MESGGNYSVQGDPIININLDLPAGYYSLTMKDSYGDGMCCGYGNGSYSLTNNSNNTVLASGGAFTFSETTTFCVGGATNNYNYVVFDNEYPPTIELNVYPNPVKETLKVSLFGTDAQSFEIINTLGQIVMKGNYSETFNVAKLRSGMYVLKLNIGEKNKIKRFVKK